MSTPKRPTGPVRGVGSNQHGDKPVTTTATSATFTSTGKQAGGVADLDPFAAAPLLDWKGDPVQHGTKDDIVDGFYEPENRYGIVAYSYQSENYTPAGLIEVLIAQGEASPAARDMDPELVLFQIADANGIDMEDETTFDSNEFPKYITGQQADTDGLAELVGSDGRTHVLYGEPSFEGHQITYGTDGVIEALEFTNHEELGDAEWDDDIEDLIRADFEDFVEDNPVLLARAQMMGQSWSTIGHDYVYSRNGHGTGFWDRGHGPIGDALHKAASARGPLDAYVGDDGKAYIS